VDGLRRHGGAAIVSTAHDLIKNQIIAGPVANRVRWQTHRYVLRQSLSFFQNDFAGRVANKIMQAAPALRDSVVQLIDAIWYAAVQWVGAAVIFAAADPLLLVPLLVWLIAYLGALLYFVPRIKERSTAASEARSMLVWADRRQLHQHPHRQAVRAYRPGGRLRARRAAGADGEVAGVAAPADLDGTRALHAERLPDRVGHRARHLAVERPASSASAPSPSSPASSCASSACSGWILWVVAGIFENIGVVQEGMETISRPNQVLDRPDSRPLVVRDGEIRLEHVSFHYGREVAPNTETGAGRTGGVIHDLSLVIAPGEKVGLVGRSGAGKSTFVNLLLRFYDLESGRILIDGQDISHVTQDSLRAQIGMVTQDTSLLHRSVLDNILYGRPSGGEAAAIAAASKAQADDFIAGSRT